MGPTCPPATGAALCPPGWNGLPQRWFDEIATQRPGSGHLNLNPTNLGPPSIEERVERSLF
jgi:hypothetical protein